MESEIGVFRYYSTKVKMLPIHGSVIEIIKFVSFLCLIIFISPLESSASHELTADDNSEKIFDTFTIYWENDAFAGTDRKYSNGFKLTWSTPYDINNGDTHLPGWSYRLINSLPFVNDPGTHRAVSLSLGQMIFTPEDTSSNNLIVDDRPYAGYLYLASGYHNRTSIRKNSWEFQFGIVGPLAFGEETQNFTHDLLSGSRAEGWDNQLGNEIALEIICESQWRLSPFEPLGIFSYDLIPHMGFRVGNIQIYANAGAEIRYGWNLPPNFGSCPIRAGCATNSAFIETSKNASGWSISGWHLFAAVDGRVVAHDIFLDGNTFRDSHKVDRKIFVGDLMAGLAMDFGKVRTTYSYVLRTKQFSAEENNHLFGSLNLSWNF